MRDALVERKSSESMHPAAPREYEEYRLKSTTAANVSHNIMILNSQSAAFDDFTPPVRLIRDRQYDSDDDEDEDGEGEGEGKQPKKPEAGLGRRKRTRILYLEDEDEIALREQESAPWLLEDFDGQHAFTGRLEGGQHGNYVFFVNQGNEFRVLPISRWYRFNPKLGYATLSLEEAERQMASGNAGARFRNSPTGAATTSSSWVGGEETVKKRKLDRIISGEQIMKRPVRSQEADEDREDLDFEDIFDDDDEGMDAEPTDEHSKQSSKKTSAAGKQVKKLIKHLDADNWHPEVEEEDEEEDPYASEEDDHSQMVASTEDLTRPTPSLKPSPASSSQPTSTPPSSQPTTTTTTITSQNLITERDIVEALSGPTPMRTKDLIGRLKGKLKADPGNKDVLRELMRRMAVVRAAAVPGGSGEDEKYLELKPEYK